MNKSTPHTSIDIDSHRKPVVMIVDDDISKRNMLKRLLCTRYEVQYADSGTEAIEKATISAPDIILLDVNMPDLDGFKTCKKLRTIDALRLSKIMIVSGRALEEDKLQGITAGANDYITLPFDETEFLLRIGNMVKLKRAEELINEHQWKASYDSI